MKQECVVAERDLTSGGCRIDKGQRQFVRDSLTAMLNTLSKSADGMPGTEFYSSEVVSSAKLSVPVPVALSRQSLLELGQRAQIDTLFFVGAEIGIPIFEPPVLNYWFFRVAVATNILCNVITWFYVRQWAGEVANRPQRAISVFTALKLCQNLSLSSLIAWIFLNFGINSVTSLATPMMIAFAQATLISLRPNARVLRATLCCCLVPPILVGLWIGGSPGYGTALILFIDLTYLWFQGTRENIDYLRALHHTQELRRARRKATEDGARIGDTLLTNAARHTATVAERNRIAYEWHDTLLAGFSAISWQLDEARLRQPDDPVNAQQAIELARNMVQHYRAEARLVIADLLYEESDAKDLVTLIDQDLRKTIGIEAIEFRLNPVGSTLLLPPDVTRQLLRICQEAVTNAVRHANPKTISVGVEFGPTEIAISIADDGCGFVVGSNKPTHFGLQIMKQRTRRLGGELAIDSFAGRGTVIRVTVPYSADFSMAPTRILVIEDQYFSRLALHTVIDSHPDMKITCEADTGIAGIGAFREQLPDVTIVDLKLPDQSGIEVIKALREIDPTARIVVLSNFEGSEYLHRATDAGAMAYLTKDSNAEELLQAIRAVRVGQSFIPPSLLHLLESRVAGNELTSREQSVLELLVHGWSNKQIGDDLGIAEKTVRIHLSSIFSKLGVANRTQAVLMALQRGFVDPQPSDKTEAQLN